MNKTKSIILTLVALAMVLIITIGLLAITRSTDDQQNTKTQSEIATFYQGKTIRLLVPSQPGGGFDAYARLLAPYIEKYTGATVLILNLPGAGGMRSTNELFNSPKDGLSIAIIGGSSMILNKLAEIKGADYEIDKFAYLGRVVADSRVLFIANQSGHENFNDIINTNTTVKIGATGLGGNGYVDGVISKEAFNLNVEIIHGFDTLAGVTQSIKRGNLDGGWGPWGSVKSIISSGTEIAILQTGENRNPDIPNVPTVHEFINNSSNPDKTKEILNAWNAFNEVGRFLAAPPGTPSDNLKFLRDAFRKAIDDPDFLANTKRSDLPVQYANAEDTFNIIMQSMEMDPEISELFVKALRGEL